MLKRLAECGAEACQEVERGLHAGRPLGDAVLDAIESLPASKTKDLRRWVNDWAAYDEWLVFEKAGWRVQRRGRYVYALAPKGRFDPTTEPSPEAVAAGIGVEGLHFHDTSHYAKFEFYEGGQKANGRYEVRYTVVKS